MFKNKYLSSFLEQVKKHFRWQETKLHTGKMFDLIQTKQLLDLSHKGSMTTIWGAVVSLPAMFSANFLQETEDNPLDLLAYDIDVTTEEGQQILGSFKLSRAARKFALAKEMCHTNTYYVHFSFMGITFSVLSCYIIATAVSSLIPLRGAKMFSYMTVVPTLGFVTLKTGDYYNCRLQAKSDRKAASIDQEVAAGGVEYYTALIARKQALEKLKIQETSNDETMLKFGLGWRKTDLTPEERRDRLLKSVKRLYPDISL